MRICIIGAGVSGLSTAFYLKSLNKHVNIDIFEKESSIGGKIKTSSRHGYSIEEGASSFLSNASNTLDLVRLLVATSTLLDSKQVSESKYIYDGPGIHKIPLTVSELFSSSLLGILSKIRVSLEIFIPSKKNQQEESVQSFGYRRFGKEFTNKVLDTIISGIFASTAEKLSFNGTFPNIVKIENNFGSLIKNIIKQKQNAQDILGKLISFKYGMSTLIDALAEQTDANIYRNIEIETIQKIDKTWRIETSNKEKHNYDIVILCTPSYVTSRIIKNTDRQLSDLLKKIEYTPVSIVSLGYETLPTGTLDGYGVLCSRKSDSNVLGIIWDSSIFDGRTEDGGHLLRVIIGGQRNPFLAIKEEIELENIAIGAVMQIMKLDIKPSFIQVSRWHKGTPHYSVGHLDLVKMIMVSTKKHKGLYLNSSAYQGVSINDCIGNSKLCAERILRENT